MNTTKLTPTFVESFEQAGNALFDGIRRRPAGAYTQDGRAVVCCPRTARKNGWTIAGRAFTRTAK